MNVDTEEETLTEYESGHLFLAFCSLVTLLHTKKMNLANVFLILLQNSSLRELFKVYCDVETDFAMVQAFLKFDPSLHKSKYIMKYLNSKGSPLNNNKDNL
jgi:hypothetical protein